MLAFKTLKPLLNRVVIKKAVAETKTKAGIILTSGKADATSYGVVVATGPGKILDNGELRPISVQVGDTVLLPEYGGAKISMEKDVDLFIYRDDDIMGTLHEPTK